MPIALKSLAILGAICVSPTRAWPAAPSPPGDGIADAEITTVVAQADAETSPLRGRETQLCAMLCADHYFQGRCEVFCTQDLQCANLGTGYQNDWASSLRVLHWIDHSCTFYEHANCQGASFTSDYDESLHDGNGFWADRISSLRCYWD
ncbi:hypothetical protein V8F33_006486 [Rhypophila sp. PSN 637]